MKTRRATSSGNGAARERAESGQDTSLPLSADARPPKLFILPEHISEAAWITALPHPVAGTQLQYLCCPRNGIYEFTRVDAPERAPRSWLLTTGGAAVTTGTRDEAAEAGAHSDGDGDGDGEGDGVGNADGHGDEKASAASNGQQLPWTGYVTDNGLLHVATPIDPIFLLLPVLAGPSQQTNQPTKQPAKQPTLYLSADDYFDQLKTLSPGWKLILAYKPLERIVQSRLSAICDSVDAAGEKMYLFSAAKLLTELVRKAQRMASGKLPPSLEREFVTACTQDDGMRSAAPGPDRAEASNADAKPDGAKEDLEKVRKLLRLRKALDMVFSYVTPAMRLDLERLLQDGKIIDFAPLDDYLAKQAMLRAESQALRTLCNNISRKRFVESVDEVEDSLAVEKRQKKEEETRRKSASYGVKQLRKADISGMMKLSTFFTKAAKPEA